jgi:uncharacterized protein YkwD
VILSNRWNTPIAALLVAGTLLACGGGGGGGNSTQSTTTSRALPCSGSSTSAASTSNFLQQEPGAPAFLGITAQDGMNWINYRRSQVGIPRVLPNPLIDQAAQGHSDYQRANNVITHEQTPGTPCFTGAEVEARLNAAGYTFAPAAHAFGEVISSAGDPSGFFNAEELITAIYHRFVIFEPTFKEIGTGAATATDGTNYFTSEFTANNGFGPGIAPGNIVNYPYHTQTNVPVDFFSDQESPDPVATQNQVGYPISVHANIGTNLTVNRFTVHPRGGADLPVKSLNAANDQHTPSSAAAIIPLSILRERTTYDVTFEGSSGNLPVTKNWSFTTR